MAPRKKPTSEVAINPSPDVDINQSTRWNQVPSQEIAKVSNAGSKPTRAPIAEAGSVSLVSMQTAIDRLAPYELRWPQCIDTFEKMACDGDCGSALEASVGFIEKAFNEWTVSPGRNPTKRSKQAAKFIAWCLNNMEGQTIRQAARSVSNQFLKHGFAVSEKVYKQVTSGEYAGKFKLKYLSSRPVASLDRTNKTPFDVANDGRTVLAVRQDPSYFENSNGLFQVTRSNIIEPIKIERSRFILFGCGATDFQPLGNSRFKTVWKDWREKNLIENQEVVGVSRDLSGTPVLYVPADILIEAETDPTSPAAASLLALKRNMANFHNGDQTHIILPSDIQDGSSTVKDYAIEFLGISGGGKQFDTSALVARRVKRIHTAMGTTFLIVGQDNVGSYNLAANNQSYHSHIVESNIQTIQEGINRDLIPQLLTINGIELADDEMPMFMSGEISDPDKDNNSKAQQRSISVGSIPLHPEVVQQNLKDLGYAYKLPEEVFEDPEAWAKWAAMYMPKPTSRAGDGMKTSGQGTSTEVGGGDASIANTENT